MNVFVGCGSRDVENEKYNKVATDIGNYIVSARHNFVFGGCTNGLMGKIYSVVSKSEKSKIVIAIVKTYEEELQKMRYDTAKVFNTTNERKDAIIELSDIIVIIPGGIGTIDELFMAIESKRNKEHDHPIIIVNPDGFFDKLIEMLEKAYTEGFASPKNKKLYEIVNTVDELIKVL